MAIDRINVKVFDPVGGIDEVSTHLARGIHDLLCKAEESKLPATLTIVFRCEVDSKGARIELHNDMLIEVER